MKERSGFKVCFDAAQNIRALVKDALRQMDKVPKEIVNIVRDQAREDSRLHDELDKNFRIGGGPAVKTNSKE
jgi:hypothetical protein